MSKDAVWPTAEIGATRGVLRQGDDDRRSAGLVVQDASGTILYANAAAGRILGLSLDQLRGLTTLDPRWPASRTDGIDLPGHEHPALVALWAVEAQRSVVWGVILPDGTRRWSKVATIPLCAEPGGSCR
jgi:PAS domain S-box-containing protein